jgi:hypothetical protein
MAVTPLARGLHLCGRVVVAPKSLDLTFESCFRAVRADRLPARMKPFSIFAHLVNGLGRVPFLVVITRLENAVPVYYYAGELVFRDRLRDIRFKLDVGQCLVSFAGLYEVSLWVNDDLVAQTEFAVIPPEQENPNGTPKPG